MARSESTKPYIKRYEFLLDVRRSHGSELIELLDKYENKSEVIRDALIEFFRDSRLVPYERRISELENYCQSLEHDLDMLRKVVDKLTKD